ncbi:unnamed protein product [Colias eurytheme]|nr:unnamed protein product [Colias eurytheme]
MARAPLPPDEVYAEALRLQQEENNYAAPNYQDHRRVNRDLLEAINSTKNSSFSSVNVASSATVLLPERSGGAAKIASRSRPSAARLGRLRRTLSHTIPYEAVRATTVAAAGQRLPGRDRPDPNATLRLYLKKLL